MPSYLTFEDGVVRVAGQTLPGILKSRKIKGELRFDESQKDGQSGKKRVPLGWEDCEVVIVLELLTDDTSDCYAKLAEINGIFRGHNGKANPKILDVVDRHMAARGLRQVLFSGLESSETDQDDVIEATLGFLEHRPPIISAEARAAKAGAQAATGTADVKKLAVDVG